MRSSQVIVAVKHFVTFVPIKPQFKYFEIILLLVFYSHSPNKGVWLLAFAFAFFVRKMSGKINKF